jgi:hypothetical protein
VITNIECRNDSFVQVLSDKRGRAHEGLFVASDFATVNRLGDVVSECQGFGFVARDTDTNTFGVVLEWQIPWRPVDGEDYSVYYMWGERNENQILDAVTKWATMIANAAKIQNVSHRVCVLTEQNGKQSNFVVVQVFIEDSHASKAPEFCELVESMSDALTNSSTTW